MTDRKNLDYFIAWWKERILLASARIYVASVRSERRVFTKDLYDERDVQLLDK